MGVYDADWSILCVGARASGPIFIAQSISDAIAVQGERS